MSPAKAIGKLLGSLCMCPHLLCYMLASLLLGREKAFIAASERLARKPGFLGVYTRQAFYRYTLHHVGKDVYFGFMSVFSKPAAKIGDRVYIGRFCSVGWVDMGPDVMLADGVQILSGRHQHGAADKADHADNRVMRDHAPNFSQVTVGKGAWLGAGAIVMADVGQHAIVAAGAVVSKPVPDNAAVGGIPAKSLREH